MKVSGQVQPEGGLGEDPRYTGGTLSLSGRGSALERAGQSSSA